jgi:polysaccharide export outer membrane protein
VLPDQDQSAEVIRVELRNLEGGELSKNVSVRDGDTVFVPRASSVYVTGRVRNPGVYPFGQNMTVLQALSLAGGATDFGATNRIKIRRQVAGREREIGVDLTSPVEAGDTIVVPERYF